MGSPIICCWGIINILKEKLCLVAQSGRVSDWQPHALIVPVFSFRFASCSHLVSVWWKSNECSLGYAGLWHPVCGATFVTSTEGFPPEMCVYLFVTLWVPTQLLYAAINFANKPSARESLQPNCTLFVTFALYFSRQLNKNVLPALVLHRFDATNQMFEPIQYANLLQAQEVAPFFVCNKNSCTLMVQHKHHSVWFVFCFINKSFFNLAKF